MHIFTIVELQQPRSDDIWQVRPGLGWCHRRTYLRRVHLHVGICVRQDHTPRTPRSLRSALGFGAHVNTRVTLPHFERKAKLFPDMTILVRACRPVPIQELVEVVDTTNVEYPFQLVTEHFFANLHASQRVCLFLEFRPIGLRNSQTQLRILR